MTRRVVVFGDGQIAESAYWHLTHDSPYEVVAFTVDAAFQRSDRLLGLPVAPFEAITERFPPDDFAMLVSISYRDTNRLRAEKYQQAKAKAYHLIRYVSSRAVTWPGLQMGDNLYLRPHAALEPLVQLGSNIVIGTGAVVGHHSRVADHCYLAARAVVSGNVVVEPYCLLGANCTIRDGVRIAERCIIGAGAVILADTEPGGVYRASPGSKLDVLSDQVTHI
jgi:sugar O-acyltransferase (sialic acid O-acetyltransferase NeuD family)